MPAGAILQKRDSAPETVSQRRFDARFPLAVITGSIFFYGAVALCRVALPRYSDWALLPACLIFLSWLVAVLKAGWLPRLLSPWDRRSGFSLPQALADGLAFFVFILVASSYVEFRLSVWNLASSAVVGLVAGLFTGWYNVPKSSS
jgi:hypothetical protein